MAKYMIEATYMEDGIQGLLSDGGSARRKAVEALISSVGGKLEAFYFAFGDNDAIVIVDVPDNVSVAAAALTAGASGAVAVKTTVLLTPEEIDAAAKMTPSYDAPGD